MLSVVGGESSFQFCLTRFPILSILNLLRVDWNYRMTLKKIGWRAIVPSCYKPETPMANTKKPVSKQSSLQRLSLSDLSNPGSPLSADDISNSLVGSNLYTFTLAELKEITHNFAPSNLLGEGGFGPVYKGFIDEKLRPRLKAQPVAVKLLDLDGLQGHREWLAEIIFLGQLKHPHLVKLIGFCCEDEQRLLIYEYMARGSLENQLFRRYCAALPWSTRMKILLGAAKGLAFLHEGDKPVIYRDFKASNILLDSDYTAKLSDFGLAKDGPEGDDTHVSTRIMGTHGYAAPEYIMTGHLTTMSDVFSFGVVLLEVVTGKRSVDKTRPAREQSLVEWARPLLKDPRKLDRVIDPRLEGQYSTKGALKALELAYRCLSHQPKVRPPMTDVVKILEPLQDFDDAVLTPFVYVVPADGEAGDDDGTDNDSGSQKIKKKEDGLLQIRQRWRHRIRLSMSPVAYSESALFSHFRHELNPTPRRISNET